MKRLITTAVLLTTMICGVFAQQRKAGVRAYWITPDTAELTVVPCNDSFDLEYFFVNVGPDTVRVTDTFYFFDPLTPDSKIMGEYVTAPVPAGDTIAHYKYRVKLLQIERLADPSDNYNDVFKPFSNGNYAIYCAAAGFYNAATPPAGYLQLDTAIKPSAAAAAIKIDCKTGIDDLFTGRTAPGLAIYPNPASRTIAFKYNFANTSATVRITDIAGRIVLSKDYGKQSGEREISLDVSGLTNGMYYVELITDKQRNVGKISISR